MQNSFQSVQYAYVDESGDPCLDLTKEGVSQFYVVTAVLADEGRNSDLITQVDTIRQKYFGQGEMKSSGISGDVKRRHSILSELKETGLKFCAIVADKSQIDDRSGLQYKKSFIKYLHGQLYKRLYRSFSSLHVFADEHGRSEFMEGFKRYLQQRYQKELFDHEDFAFAASTDHPLIQAADVIGGTLLRIYSGKDSSDFLELLSDAAIIVERWPPSASHSGLFTGLADKDQFDYLVSQQGIMLARDFIYDHDGNDDPDIESQVEALRYLLYRYELDPAQYIHAQPILDHVNSYRDEEMSLQSFRMNVIAKLRSHGVIIASSNSGYKIPNTTSDISDFVSLVDGQVLPYLRRLAQARDHLLIASQGKYDIVPQEGYSRLLACLLTLNH